MAEFLPLCHKCFESKVNPKITLCSAKDSTLSKSLASSGESHTKDCVGGLSNLETQELYKAGSFQRESKLTNQVSVESVEARKHENPNGNLAFNSRLYCNRRNAICEAIEKQCIDYKFENAESLHQKRDNLRLEYVFKQLCLL